MAMCGLPFDPEGDAWLGLFEQHRTNFFTFQCVDIACFLIHHTATIYRSPSRLSQLLLIAAGRFDNQWP